MVAVVALVALVVAVAATWPLARHLDHAAPDRFDPRFQAWTIDWVQFAVRHPAHLYDANIFAPNRGSLAFSDPLIGVAVPLLPMRWLGLTPIAIFNVALLIGSAFSAAAGYAFTRVVTGSRLAGVVGAAAFAFGGFSTVEASHLQTVFRPGVAVAATLAWLLADRGAGPRRLMWLLALALTATIVWQCSVSFYTGAYALVAAVVVLGVRWRSVRWPSVAAIAVAMLGMVGLAVPYLSHGSALPGFHWTLRDLAVEGADFTHADPRLWAWGPVLGAAHPYPAARPALFPGAVLLVLAVAGAVIAWRGGPRARRVLLLALALIAVGAVAAVGTSDTGWRQWAPYRAVFSLVPAGGALRATYRAWMLGLLGLGLLAGIGAEAAVTALRTASRRVPAAAIVAVLAAGGVVLEGYPRGVATVPVGVQPVDRALSALPPGGVLYLPVSLRGEPLPYLSLVRQAEFVYRSTAHHRPMPNGYAAFFPSSYFEVGARVRSLPSGAAIAYLRSIGVRYVVVPTDGTAGAWTALADPARAAPLRVAARDRADLLYSLP